MNRTEWLGRLLTFGGVLEVVAGLGLLVDPAGGAMALFGEPLNGPGVFLSRLGGGGLLSLGIACWLARKTPEAPAGAGVARAFLVYNGIASCTLAWASVSLDGSSWMTLAASALHGSLGVVMLSLLFGRK